LGTSYNLNHYLLFGLQTKLTNFNHARLTQDFFLLSMNAGVLAFLGDYIGVGLKMENFLRSKSRGSVAPYILGTGASFNHRLFRLAGDFERDFSNKAIRLKAGLDWAVVEWLNLKGGYEQLKGSGETQNSVAGGFSWKWARNTDFDLAFLDRLDSSFYVWSVGLALKF